MEAAAGSFLPDDMVLEILTHVEDVAALFRCAMACKLWRRLLVADPSFLRRCLSEKARRSSPLPGFFAQLRCERGTRAPCLVQAPRPVLGPGPRFLSSFLSGLDDPGFFDDAVPLISRHGLLLLRLKLPPSSKVHLAVCDLLAGTFQVLPYIESLFLPSLEDTGYALLTAQDCSSLNDDELPCSFKVVVIGIYEYTRVYHLHTYSSTTGEPGWNTCYGRVENSDIRTTFRQPNAVVRRGVAHWLLWGSMSLYTLQVCARSGHMSFAVLPAKLHDLCFGVGYDEPYLSVDTQTQDERLSMIYLQKEHLQLEFWTWNDDGSLITSRTLKLKLPDRPQDETRSVLYWCLGEKNGTVLVKDNSRRVYVVDFKTQALQEITAWPRDYHTFVGSFDRETIVPVEMDWPAYFLSRLGIGK